MGKKSFSELVKEFEIQHGSDWCRNPDVSEQVVDTFLDFLMSKSESEFAYWRVSNMK